MVVRFWSARTTQLRFPDYLRHFDEKVLSQSDGVVVAFIVETLWSSMEAIDRFAGPDREAAVVAVEALHLLTSYDRRVRHYEVEVREVSQPLATAPE